MSDEKARKWLVEWLDELGIDQGTGQQGPVSWKKHEHWRAAKMGKRARPHRGSDHLIILPSRLVRRESKQYNTRSHHLIK